MTSTGYSSDDARRSAPTCRHVFDPDERTGDDPDDCPRAITSEVACVHEPYRDSDYCLFHLPADARERYDPSPADYGRAFREAIRDPRPGAKRFVGAHLPALDLEYAVVSGATKHPIDLRYATIEGTLDLRKAELARELDLSYATVGGLDLSSATVAEDCRFTRARFAGEVEAYETAFRGDATFTGATFDAPASFTEAAFAADVRFDGATFAAPTCFERADLHSDFAYLHDDATFAGATFAADVTFDGAQFGVTDLRDAVFESAADFSHARFTERTRFAGATFAAAGAFVEASFTGDVTFENVEFAGPARLRGVRFAGESNTQYDDATFAGAVFVDDADFSDAEFRYVSFDEATVRGEALFTRTEYDDDADFVETAFRRGADFDEAIFDGDADFTDATFGDDATFRGARFDGESRHHEDAAVFVGTTFNGVAEFDDTYFYSAAFRETRFGGCIDFTEAVFDDDMDFHLSPTTADAYVDMTAATLRDGVVRQPETAWMPYDLTDATVGDVTFTASKEGRHELLDYFRFCLTDFEDFDFRNHYDYFRRNDWKLHAFRGDDAGVESSVEMTPDVIERTYLKAKVAASAVGAKQAAGEFRIKRQRHAHDANLELARDPSLPRATRLRKRLRASEITFMELTCGHGIRFARAVAVFVVAPLPFGLLFTFGGPLFETQVGQLSSLGQLATSSGLQTLVTNTYFAYASYTTIGYGDYAPVGHLARALAISEAFLITLLGGLFIYTLIKRSER